MMHSLIVKTAIEKSRNIQTKIVSEDIDLLVFLTALAPEEKNIYFLKHGKR